MSISQKRWGLALAVLVCLAAALFGGPALSRFASGPAVLQEPVYWHVMGTDAHMSLRIREAKGGVQQVKLDMWLPEGVGAPKDANVYLRSGERTVDVPLLYVGGGPDPYGFEGFDKYTYESEGAFLDKAASWIMEVRVTDVNGANYAYDRTEEIPG